MNEQNVLKIKTALISVFNKDGIDEIVNLLHKKGVKIISTGGTFEYIKTLGIPAISVESITEFPEILGGRVKTLHPKIFGGILFRRESDLNEIKKHQILEIDLVIVDLYPFEESLKQGFSETDLIEKIDIGGVSLIRAAAKNFNDVLVVSSKNQYEKLIEILKNNAETNLEIRRKFATEAFQKSSNYDNEIFQYFASDQQVKALRYGENPHQNAKFIGNFEANFEQLNGKEISYNNLLDIDAAIDLISDFSEPTFAIIKHNNACGIASDNSLKLAWEKALASDPISAFGGIIICNRKIEKNVADEINKLFFEILIAPDFSTETLEILKSKKNRIILKTNKIGTSKVQTRTVLNGILHQEKNQKIIEKSDLKFVTQNAPTESEISDLLFANIVVKHTKSNAIVIVKNKQLIGVGMGQTSRIDALKQAIEKSKSFNFDLKNSVLASDAFFPFADAVEIAFENGINTIIQPGGSINDQKIIDFCNENEIKMVFTGVRNFKH
jgi:phosphoribosylaminoimidazolecarboxamide formyltransferase/IMP cyclohydrolase